MSIILILLAIYSIIIIIVGNIFSTSISATLIFVTTAISEILIILCWQFAISIYKKKKLIFIIGGIGYCLLTLIYRLSQLMAQVFWLISLVPLAAIIFGMFLIIFAELRMKKKGLLHWV